MAEEVLGIRIKIELGDFEAQLSKLNRDLAAVGANAAKGAEAGVKATKNQLKLLSEAWGGSAADAKKKLNEMYDIQQVQKFVKQRLDIEKAGLEETNAAQKKAAEEALRIERDKYAKLASLTLEQHRRLGTQPVNGGWVLKSVDTRQTTESAFIEASKINAEQIRKAGVTEAAAYTENARRIQDAGKAEVSAYAENSRRKRKALLDEVSAHDENARRIQDAGKAEVSAYAENARRIRQAGLLEVQAIEENKKRIAAADLTQARSTGTWGTSRTTQETLAGEYLSGLSKQGMRVVNGKEEYIAKQSNLLNISLKNMAARLAEFYSLRNILFAVSTQFGDVVTGALDFNQKIHDIAAIAGSTKAEMKEMGDSILQIATHSRYSAAEVGNLMEVLAQAGVAAKDLPQVASTVGMFATGTGATPQQAAEIFTTAANVWKIDAEDSTRIANVLTAALNNSKLSVQGLATSFNYLAPQAAMLGYSLEETAGMVASLSQVGIKASTIGTGLSQLLKDLSAPKQRFAEMLARYKISLDEINPRLHSFSDIVAVFNARGVSAVDIMAKMDSRSGRALVASMLAGSAAIKTMTASITGTSAAVRAYETAMDGARAKMNVLKQETLKAAIDAGNPLGKVFMGIVEGATAAVRGLSTLNGQLIVVAASVAALGVAVSFNPVFAGITVGIVAVASALAWVGRETDALRNSVNQHLDEAVDKAARIQRTTDVVNAALYEAEANDPATMTKVRKLHAEGKAPEASRLLDNTKVKNSEAITKALQEEEGAAAAVGAAYQTQELTLGKLMRVKDGMRLAKEREVTDVFDKDLANLRKQEEEIRTRMSARKAIIAQGKAEEDRQRAEGKTAPFGGHDYYKALKENTNDQKELTANLTAQDRVKPFATPRKGKVEQEMDASRKKLEDTLKEMERRAAEGTDSASKPFSYGDYAAEESLKDEAQRKSALISILIATFDDAHVTLETKKENLKEAIRLAKEEIVAQELLDLEQERDKYNEDPDKTPADKAAYKRRQAEIDNKYTDLQAKREGGIKDSFAKSNPQEVDTLTGEKTEKRQANSLSNLQRANALRKEGVWTAQQQLAIDIETGAFEIRSLETTKQAYQEDLLKLQANKELQEKHRAYYEQLPELIENVNYKLKETNAQQERLADQSVWGNLKQGMRQGVTALGAMKSATVDLGQSVIATFANGISGALDTMIQKLQQGKSGWVAFRDGMKAMMADIGQIIQQYITKLIALWIIQKLTGFMAGSGELSANGMQTGTTLPNPGTNAIAGMAKGGLIQRLAEGGTVLNGIPGGQIPLNLGVRGKDSVPIIGMPGEFMMSTRSVEHYGVDFFKKANALQLADGGLVGAGGGKSSKPADAKEEAGGDMTLQIVNVVDPASVNKPVNAAQVLNIISMDTVQNGRTFRLLKSKIRE